MRILGINHITLACTNIERSFFFYRNVLGFKPLVKWHKGAYFIVGNCWFCLNLDLNRQPKPCCTHYAFTVSLEDFHTISNQIATSGALIFKKNTSPGESLYFLDPDGHKLEIHTGNYQSRIEAKKADIGSWQHVEWFI